MNIQDLCKAKFEEWFESVKLDPKYNELKPVLFASFEASWHIQQVRISKTRALNRNLTLTLKGARTVYENRILMLKHEISILEKEINREERNI